MLFLDETRAIRVSKLQFILIGSKSSVRERWKSSDQSRRTSTEAAHLLARSVFYTLIFMQSPLAIIIFFFLLFFYHEILLPSISL